MILSYSSTFFNKNFYSINIFINITAKAPGIPSRPIKTDVTTFIPMWKFQILPIIFIIKINKAPNKEFKHNFNISLIGTIKIFPIINKKKIHATKAIILLVFNLNHLS